MIEHIVLFSVKEGVEQVAVEETLKQIRMLKGRIQGILSITCGKNNSPERKAQGYEFGFIVRFEDEHSRDVYLKHPEHLGVIERYIAPIVKQVLVFDY